MAVSEHKTALLIGLGQTGAASACWLKRQGHAVRLLDTRQNPAGVQTLIESLGDAVQATHLGDEAVPSTMFEQLDWVVLSPGVSPQSQPIADWLQQARQAGAQIIGEVELFALALAQLNKERGYAPKIVAVTGTNGKTTVTALARNMVREAGLSVCAAGNISPSVLEALMQALDQDDLPQVWVLELSSFQMMTTHSLVLDAAVVLNLSQDHLDWHGDMVSYVKAKAKVLSMARLMLVNRDDPVVLEMVPALTDTRVRSFGATQPTLAGDVGLTQDGGVTWLTAAQPDSFPDLKPARRRGKTSGTEVREAGVQQHLMPAQALQLVGLHNVLNVLAASLLVNSLEIGWPPILRAAADYEGEPHRMQFVRTVREVDFFNDSKGTNVGATVAGIEGMDRRIVLIAGGVAKGQEFAPLAELLHRRDVQVVLIGVDASVIQSALTRCGVVSEIVSTLQEAVKKAFDLSSAGHAVILSPACASFDMFANYVRRGEAFVDAVHSLALDQGEVA